MEGPGVQIPNFESEMPEEHGSADLVSDFGEFDGEGI